MTVKMIVKSNSEVCLGCRGCSSLIILFCFTIYLIGGVLILWKGMYLHFLWHRVHIG